MRLFYILGVAFHISWNRWGLSHWKLIPVFSMILTVLSVQSNHDNGSDIEFYSHFSPVHFVISLFYFKSFGNVKKRTVSRQKWKTAACDVAGFPARSDFPMSARTHTLTHTHEGPHKRFHKYRRYKGKKGKAAPVHTIRRVVAPLIFKLGTSRVVNIAPWPLYHRRNSPWYTVRGGLGGPHSAYGHFWGLEKSLAAVGNRISDLTARSLDTIPSMMRR